MKLIEALRIVEKQRDDFKETSDNYETVFPGAVSSFHDLVEAFTVAASAIEYLIGEYGEDHILS